MAVMYSAIIAILFDNNGGVVGSDLADADLDKVLENLLPEK